MPMNADNPSPPEDFRTVLKNQSVAAAGLPLATKGAVIPSSPAANIDAVAIGPVVNSEGALFMSDPIGTGPNGTSDTHYNPTLFATDTAAAAIAAQLGGVVYKAPLREAGGGTPGSPFHMPDANYIKMPNGAIANAGTLTQWASIGRFDLIRNEIATPAPTTGSGSDQWYALFPGPNQSALAAGLPLATKGAVIPSSPTANIDTVAISAVVNSEGPLFMSDPIGTGPIGIPDTHYNPTLFATDTAAAAIAAQLGGAVYKAPLREAGGGTPGSPFQMPDANYIKMPNGAIANAGTLTQWASIGRFDLIRNEIATPTPTTGSGSDQWYALFPGPNV